MLVTKYLGLCTIAKRTLTSTKLRRSRQTHSGMTTHTSCVWTLYSLNKGGPLGSQILGCNGNLILPGLQTDPSYRMPLGSQIGT